MIDATYHESLLALYRNPLNKGVLTKYDDMLRSDNPACGDHLVFYVVWKNGKISDIKWDGDGCALSVASASLFSEQIKGKSLTEIKKIKHGKLLKLLHIDKLTAGREKCVDLPIGSFENK